jgi:DNA repair ATPase RecN
LEPNTPPPDLENILQKIADLTRGFERVVSDARDHTIEGTGRLAVRTAAVTATTQNVVEAVKSNTEVIMSKAEENSTTLKQVDDRMMNTNRKIDKYEASTRKIWEQYTKIQQESLETAKLTRQDLHQIALCLRERNILDGQRNLRNQLARCFAEDNVNTSELARKSSPHRIHKC